LRLALLAALARLPLARIGPRLLLAALVGVGALVALLAALFLPVLEGLVAQFLLLAGHAIQFAELVLHLALSRVHLAGPGLLEIAHHVVEFVEQALGLLGLAALVQLVDAVEHVVEIARGHRPEILRHLAHLVLAAILLVALHLLGQFAHVAVHRLAQFLGQARQLLLIGAALHGLLQPVLCGAQLAFGVREVAILEQQGQLPKVIDHLEQPRITACRAALLGDETHAEIGAGLLE
jgi:hypothetical protein